MLASYSLIAQRSARYNNTLITGEEGKPCILYIHLAGLPLDVYVEGGGVAFNVSASYLLICQLQLVAAGSLFPLQQRGHRLQRLDSRLGFFIVPSTKANVNVFHYT